MASAARKRARTGGGGEADEEPVPVADGFEAPIFGARVVGQVSTLALEGEDGPLASLELRSVGSDHPSRLRTRCCTSRRPGACAPWQPSKAASSPVSQSARTGACCLGRTAATTRSVGWR
mmetsp:Transcript_5680/g.18320  ORF Transcript_5680/g.18320 Transcript_5680/m.18320 type:complete len:120 (-) Transcript_5680:245-604(-)